jgi:hypothetical protein
MRKLLLFVLLTSVIWSSCKKATVESINTNNSRDSLTYQPSVPGSVWKYTRITAGTNVNTTTTTRLNRNDTLNGKIYFVFETVGDIFPPFSYTRREPGKYYQIVPASTNNVEALVLDTLQPLNQTWIGAVNGTDEYSYKIVQKFPTYSLDAFSFKNVYHVYNEKRTSGNLVLFGNTYYAQGVGLIYSDGTAYTNLGAIPFTLKLTNLDLK